MIEESPQITEKLYFRSFSAHRQPLQPRGRIEFSQAQALSTYYVASYDEHGRLLEFSKMLRGNKDNQVDWHIVFTESYSYFESGNVKHRTLKIPGQADQSWEFTDHRRFWSDYFERCCNWWFSSAGPGEHLSSAQVSLLVHEQFTEVELSTFEASIGVARNDEWSYEVTMKLLQSAREILEQVESIAVPRICAVAIVQGKCEGTIWKGFDEPEPNLFAVIDSWRESHVDADNLGPNTIRTERDLDEMGRRWASESQIGSITFAPIRVADGDELVAAAMLVLTTQQAASDASLCVVNSIFRRVVTQIQWILDLARTFQDSSSNSRWL